MAAVLMAMHHNNQSRKNLQPSFKVRDRSQSEELIIQSDALLHLTSNPEEKAAMVIQRAVGNRLLGHGKRLRRRPLMERMTLEIELIGGLRMLFLCAAMFVLVIYAAVIESQGPRRLGLLSTYQNLFQLDDSLAEVTTAAGLFDLLRVVSENSRRVMPVSSENFVEDSGEVKLLSGRRRFRRTLVFNNEDMDPRISSPSFTFMAWIQVQFGNGGTIIRKPLGDSLAEKPLSCWAWYEGIPTSKFGFGAHDFRGAGSSSVREEVAVGTHVSTADDGKWHLMAVVVDATGRMLEIGSPSVPRMAELTFFARSLDRSEMAEIAVAGFTLQSLAAGKVLFVPVTTPVDELKASIENSFAAAASRNLQLQDSVAVESILNRGTVTTSLFPIPPPDVKTAVRPPHAPGCELDKWFAGSSCHIIQDVPNSSRTDDAGRLYYEMLPASVRDGAEHDQRLFVDWGQVHGYVSYNGTGFPSWCGGSATFSMWIRSDQPVDPGYVIRVYPKLQPSPWSIYVPRNGIDAYGDKVPGDLTTLFPDSIGALFEAQAKDEPMRHIATVFDGERNSFRNYLDGVMFSEVMLDINLANVSDFDCYPRHPDDYISLFHRQPGAWVWKGDVQDFRFYPHAALTDEEVHHIAYPPHDDDTVGPQRKCQTAVEGGDSDWADVLGHPCSWYQAMRETVPSLCYDDEVKRECPLACQSIPSCHEKERAEPDEQTVFERVMHLTEKKKHQGVLCVREGLDVVKQCREREAAKDPKSYPPGWEGPWDTSGRFTPNTAWLAYQELFFPQVDINVTDCDLLEEVVDPFCAFATPDDWTQSFHSKVEASNELTVTMWVKLLGEEIMPSVSATRVASWDQYPRRIQFLSSVAPPKAFLDFAITRENVLAWIYQPTDLYVEEVTPKTTMEPGRWIHLALSMGLPDPVTGIRSFLAMADSAVMFDAMLVQTASAGQAWQWDSNGAPDFLQAIQFPGDILVSPISISPRAQTPKELQAAYYQAKVDQNLRRGPRNTDEVRLTDRIEYERPVYPYPVVLVSPPVVLQERWEGASTCVHDLGTSYIQQLWQQTVDGVTCLRPYECPETVLAEPRGLLSCTTEDAPEVFFGQRALMLDGKWQFAEFLQSVADASILVRDSTAHETQNFIDGMTSTVAVVMVAFSPDNGIASTIRVTAKLAADVKVDFAVEHFQSLEGDDLSQYRLVAFLGVALAVVILIDKTVTAWYKHDKKYALLALDMVVQVVLPITYFSLRYSQVAVSNTVIAETVGQEGLAGVPWASTEVQREEKMEAFFAGMERLSQKISEERMMGVFYFAHATICLLRLIAQTSVHPRLSILVGTIRNAAMDLWHFLLLLMVLYGGFLALAMAQFSGQRSEFATPLSTFETLYDMMLGSLPESGEIPSQFWAYDPLIMVFALAYNFLVFMIMLNFIIAIIVEAYMKVVEDIVANEAEQEFVTDCVSVAIVTTKATLRRWPAHDGLLRKLESSAKSTLGYMELRKVVPGWHPASLRAFLEHYARYECMDPAQLPRNQAPRYNYMKPDEGGASSDDLKLCDAVDEIEKRVALMLGTSVPTHIQKVLARQAAELEDAKTKKEAKFGRVSSAPVKRKRSIVPPELATPQRLRSDASQADSGNLARQLIAVKDELAAVRTDVARFYAAPPPAAPESDSPPESVQLGARKVLASPVNITPRGPPTAMSIPTTGETDDSALLSAPDGHVGRSASGGLPWPARASSCTVTRTPPVGACVPAEEARAAPPALMMPPRASNGTTPLVAAPSDSPGRDASPALVTNAAPAAFITNQAPAVLVMPPGANVATPFDASSDATMREARAQAQLVVFEQQVVGGAAGANASEHDAKPADAEAAGAGGWLDPSTWTPQLQSLQRRVSEIFEGVPLEDNASGPAIA